MLQKEDEIKFNQLILNFELGKYNSFEKNQRVIFLSKGFLVSLNNGIFFYDYSKFSKTLIISFNEKEKLFTKISKLLDDKFCVYTLNETLIYQFNNEDFSVTLLKRINLNLISLIEIEKNVFINTTEKNMYIWKELKSVIKSDHYIILSLVILIVCIIIPKLILANYGVIITIIISIYFAIILENIINKYIYIVYPYKKLKYHSVYNIAKCGNNLCCIKNFESIRIFNYKTYETIYELVSTEENPLNWSFRIINEKYIIIIDKELKRLKIYDCCKNMIIKEQYSKFIDNFENTCKIGDNIFITIQKQMIIKWKYNFQNNDIMILSRENRKYLYFDRLNISEFVNMKIIKNKLYLLKMKYTNAQNYKKFNLYIYQ